MPIGTVKFFDSTKGFGFIQPDDGSKDAFVHISAVERAGMSGLSENQRIAYDLAEERPGKMSAINLKSPEENAKSDQPDSQPETSDEQDRAPENS
jgi:CspA family cold shock protein